MTSKRPVILMGILMVLVLGYFGSPWLEPYYHSLLRERPLPGENSISNLQMKRAPDGRWFASFDYYFTGDPEYALVKLEQVDTKEGANQPVSSPVPQIKFAERGRHHVEFEVRRHYDDAVKITKEVRAEFRANPGGDLAKPIAWTEPIIWPNRMMMMVERDLATLGPEKVIDNAIRMIDIGSRDDLARAKSLLERVIEKDAKLDAAYVELARVAMKTNWGPEGLAQAESLIHSALQIQPESVNAKILLGYVYAYQKRYKEAEALFTEASKLEGPNLWLWPNWGELYELQGKPEAAIAKFREAIARPAAKTTYDRARHHSYMHLVTLLEERKDFEALEEMHKKRIADYADDECYGSEYAMFILRQRADAAASMGLARRAVESNCNPRFAREVLGVAYYASWAAAQDPQRTETLHQARVYLPAGPRMFYRLASSDKLADVARALVAAGDRIDQQDNDKLNALAYAFQAKDLGTARRLMRLGAKPDAPVGQEGMPVALIPVVMRDFEGIRLLQRAGVDYQKIKYQGKTAIEHARTSGDKPLLDALQPKGNTA